MTVSNLEFWKEAFYFDAESPTGLRWRRFNKAIKPSAQRFAGDVAGFKKRVAGGGFDYYRVKLAGKNYPVHRIVWSLYHDQEIPEKFVVNHKDCNTFNNNIDNLEICRQVYNSRRRKDHTGAGLSKANSSGTTGVSFEIKRDTKRGTESAYYVSQWTDLGGRHLRKHFSVKRYGNELAEFLAQEYRSHQIDLLNLQGAGYPERCGI